MAMSHKSEDISNLFSLFNREGKSHYREILKKDHVDEAQQRWPVFSQVTVGVNPAQAVAHPANSPAPAPAAYLNRQTEKQAPLKPLLKPLATTETPLHHAFGRNSAITQNTPSKLFQKKEQSKAGLSLFNNRRQQNSETPSRVAERGMYSAPQTSAPVQQSLQSLFKRLEYGTVREQAPSSGSSQESAAPKRASSGISSIFQRYR